VHLPLGSLLLDEYIIVIIILCIYNIHTLIYECIPSYLYYIGVEYTIYI